MDPDFDLTQPVFSSEPDPTPPKRSDKVAGWIVGVCLGTLAFSLTAWACIAIWQHALGLL